MRRKLNLRGDPNRRVSNFTGRIKEMHVFIGNFTYVIDFMIVEDISSIIDPRNEEDKRRGVEYVMGKILGFYKECLELGPEYLIGIADEGEVIFDEKKLGIIMEYLVKISKKARILELKRGHLKITVLTSYTPYPSWKIRCICACTSQKTTKEQDPIR
ncbi:hypothetical protein Tco_1397782, partial [Tanacetum coccineum]